MGQIQIIAKYTTDFFGSFFQISAESDARGRSYKYLNIKKFILLLVCCDVIVVYVYQEDMSWRVRGRGQLSHAIELACGAAIRLRTLELLWPTIFVEMIEEVLRDFADMENHVKDQMRTLMDSL